MTYKSLVSIMPFEAQDTKTWCWVVNDPLVWEDDDGLLYTVPQGFYTDLGTIPWFVRWLFNPADAQCAKAYILHDYLLSTKLGQYYAINEFYKAMKADGVPLWKRVLQYAGIWIAIDE